MHQYEGLKELQNFVCPIASALRGIATELGLGDEAETVFG